jgi:hypothetical protein
MAFGREDYAVAGTNRGANVIRLTGFLRDDDLIGHVACREEAIRKRGDKEHNKNIVASQAAL